MPGDKAAASEQSQITVAAISSGLPHASDWLLRDDPLLSFASASGEPIHHGRRD
jgi:hypothetical protein